MPEGPEIRIAADKIAKVIKNQRIEHIEVGLPSLQHHVNELTSREVSEVETRGKALLIHFDSGLTVYSHNQLYGKWMTCKRGEYPDTNRSLRLALHTKTESAILYSASDISVWKRDDIHQQPLISRLGPDVLHQSTTVELIHARLVEDKFKNRSLSSLYLDQGFLAGIGNYLRSEILFAAKLHPEYKPIELNSAQLLTLAAQTIIISKRAYESGGYTINDDFFERLDANNADYEAVRFMVFNREDQPCRLCQTTIQKTQKNSRRIYWCDGCQPKRPAS